MFTVRCLRNSVTLYKISAEECSQKGIVLIHDNARPHTSNKTWRLLQDWLEPVSPPLYCPDLAPSYFISFYTRKHFLVVKNSTMMTSSKNITWLTKQVATFYEKDIQKPVPCYDKCLQSGGSYVERQFKVCSLLCNKYFFCIYTRFVLLPNKAYFVDVLCTYE